MKSPHLFNLQFKCFPSLSAEVEDEDRDSDKEDKEITLAVDQDNYPILPAAGHFNLDKKKNVIRIYVQGGYRESISSLFFGYISDGFEEFK